MTDGQLRDGVYRALRRFTQSQPPTRQVDSITALIRRGVRIDWPASREGTSGLSREAGEAGLSVAAGLPLSAVAGRLVG
jgi:hypothetical protein